MKRMVLLLAVLTLVAGACGGDGEEETAPTPPLATGAGRPSPAETTPTPATACSPSGTELEVEAENIAFDAECLAAPAATPFTIKFKNRDEGIPHNVAIESEEEILFEGEIFQGDAERTYEVEPISAGNYAFFCTVHPVQMRGTFVVE